MKLGVILGLFIIIGVGSGVYFYNKQASQGNSTTSTITSVQELTPLVADMKERYDLNKNAKGRSAITLATITNCNNIFDFEVPCTEKDIEALKRLSDANDIFGADVYAQLKIHNFEEKAALVKRAADLGAPFGIRSYIISKDISVAEKYINNGIKLSTMPEGTLMFYYLKNNMHDKFCETAKEGYKKHGIEFLSAYFIDRGSESSKLIFSKCNIFKETDPYKIITSMGKEEAELIRASMLVHEKKWDVAARIYETLRASSDERIAMNSQACIGIMTYYGYGYNKDKNKGLSLITDSYNKGLINLYAFLYTNENQKIALPKTKVVVTYGTDCLQIK